MPLLPTIVALTRLMIRAVVLVTRLRNRARPNLHWTMKAYSHYHVHIQPVLYGGKRLIPNNVLSLAIRMDLFVLLVCVFLNKNSHYFNQFKLLALQQNCPLIASTSIQQGAILKMFICRDTIMKNVTLMVYLFRTFLDDVFHFVIVY